MCSDLKQEDFVRAVAEEFHAVFSKGGVPALQASDIESVEEGISMGDNDRAEYIRQGIAELKVGAQTLQQPRRNLYSHHPAELGMVVRVYTRVPPGLVCRTTLRPDRKPSPVLASPVNDLTG